VLLAEDPLDLVALRRGRLPGGHRARFRPGTAT
jgi:hypothetical protein